MSATERAERLLEIRDEMKELLDEAKSIMRRCGNRHARDAAEAYWIPHIEMALSNDHDWLGGCPETMTDACEALDSDANGDDDGDEPGED